MNTISLLSGGEHDRWRIKPARCSEPVHNCKRFFPNRTCLLQSVVSFSRRHCVPTDYLAVGSLLSELHYRVLSNKRIGVCVDVLMSRFLLFTVVCISRGLKDLMEWFEYLFSIRSSYTYL